METLKRYGKFEVAQSGQRMYYKQDGRTLKASEIAEMFCEYIAETAEQFGVKLNGLKATEVVDWASYELVWNDAFDANRQMLLCDWFFDTNSDQYIDGLVRKAWRARCSQ